HLHVRNVDAAAIAFHADLDVVVDHPFHGHQNLHAFSLGLWSWAKRRARASTGASTMAPSNRKAPSPCAAAATSTRRAQALCSSLGPRAALTGATWAGCMHSLAPKPKRRARRASAPRRSVSCN